MAKHNAANARIKREYFIYLKEAQRRDERVCTTPEELKAWSQNLGHERVMTTFTSYGNVAPHRQAELIRGIGVRPPKALFTPAQFALVKSLAASL